MSGRRNHARFVVSSNDGVLQVARDVSVIWTDAQLIAISIAAATVGDSLKIETIVGGVTHQFSVLVEECRPIIAADAIRYLIRLTRTRPDRRRSNSRARDTRITMEDAASILERPSVAQPARLSRDNRVRMVNCSNAACLLETTQPVAVNTVAGLQVSFGGKVFDDVVRVVRCESIVENDGIYRVAVEFLSVGAAYAGSLRYLMRQEISDMDDELNDRGYE